jgi:uncharacterized repeat protein (TIGR01451 family)
MLWLADGRRLVLLATAGLFLCTSAANAARRPAAQVDPSIQHNAIECWPRDQFLVLRAGFQPGVEVMSAKVYFRSDKYLDFYYVELTVEPTGGGQAVMPKPSLETEKIIYYLEMVTRSYTSARSAEWDPPVIESGECRRRDPMAAWFTGDSPNIVVGATRLGAPAIPAGFEASGITGFINAAGVAGGAGGGGLGAAPVLVAVGAAGATAGVVAGSQGGGGGTTSSIAAATSSSTSTSTATVSTVPLNPPPLACFTTTPNPPVIFEGEAVRFDASCSKGDRTLRADSVISYRWDFANGKIVEGPDRRVVSTLYTERGLYDVRLTVLDEAGGEDSTNKVVTVQAPLPPTTISTTSTTTTSIGLMADLVVTKKANLDPVNVGDDKFEYEVKVTNLGPNEATGVELVDTLPASIKPAGFVGPCNLVGLVVTCNFSNIKIDETVTVIIRGTPTVAETITNKATVKSNETDPDPKSNSVSIDTRVLPVVPARAAPLETAFRSFLGVGPFDGGARGEVLWNGALLASTDSSAPFPHQLSGKSGENRIEAYLAREASESGFWRFDFSGARHFVAGSIRVEKGQVLSVDAYAVVFALSGKPGERLEFRFELEP